VKALFRSCTLDNGKEFALHEKISQTLDGQVYFAHPYSSWERGTNENTNGLIRQYFPKNCDVLGMKTPNELLFGIPPIVALGY